MADTGSNYLLLDLRTWAENELFPIAEAILAADAGWDALDFFAGFQECRDVSFDLFAGFWGRRGLRLDRHVSSQSVKEGRQYLPSDPKCPISARRRPAFFSGSSPT